MKAVITSKTAVDSSGVFAFNFDVYEGATLLYPNLPGTAKTARDARTLVKEKMASLKEGIDQADKLAIGEEINP